MDQAYEGTEVQDREGESIGLVERIWVDDEGTPYVIEVGTGNNASHLIPLAGAVGNTSILRVRYTKAVVEGSPVIPAHAEMLDGPALAAITSYYRQHQDPEQPDTWTFNTGSTEGGRQDPPPVATEGTEVRVGEIRDLGEVIEIPIVEEEIEIVKRPIVKEVIRIHKRTVTEERLVQADVRKEDVEVEELGAGQDDQDITWRP